MNNRWFVSIPLALLVLFLVACGGATDGPSADSSSLEEAAAQELDAAEIYADRCARCHGADRSGGQGPALLPERLTRESTDYQSIIQDGFKGMPAFSNRLSSGEIGDLVEFILSEP